MDNKFLTFLGIAKALNSQNIVPIIYGSVGFYHLIGEQLDEVGDTDIIVPNPYVADKFDELKEALTRLGYKQDPNFPHEFSKGEGQIGFEPESDLSDLQINIDTLKETELEGAKFKELSLADYQKVYNRNLQTQESKLAKIKNKLEAIDKLLKNN